MTGPRLGPPALLTALGEHARTAPDRTALTASGTSLNYRMLHDQVERAALGLARRGAGPGQHVGIVGYKTVEAVLGILAILRSGAAYVPLDPGAPVRRSAALAADAGCRIVLVPAPEGVELGASLAQATGALPVTVGEATRAAGAGAVPAGIGREDIAYCMYTSGSTGRPKGVQIPHRALDAFFAAVHPLLGVGPGDRCLNTSALHFNVSVVDILYPLLRGATVYLGPPVPLPSMITGLIERERITHLAAVGSTLALVADRTAGFRDCDISSLRRVMTGAEVLSPRAVQQWLAAAPDAVVINGYGPTEATCLVIAHPITPRAARRTGPYPIGRPLAGVSIRFRHDDGQIDTRGPGEILIAGDQVMTGYLSQPDEDARAFTVLAGQRFYRTGDRGHRHPDGEIRFDGRRDDEVKVRGYRVNLQEVRQALESHELVGRAFVSTAVDAAGRPILACAVVPQGAPAAGAPAAGPGEPRVAASTLPPLDPARAQSLRTHLTARLPGYMVPADFRLLAEVPMLSTGKPDSATIKRLLSMTRQEVA